MIIKYQDIMISKIICSLISGYRRICLYFPDLSAPEILTFCVFVKVHHELMSKNLHVKELNSTSTTGRAPEANKTIIPPSVYLSVCLFVSLQVLRLLKLKEPNTDWAQSWRYGMLQGEAVILPYSHVTLQHFICGITNRYGCSRKLCKE